MDSFNDYLATITNKQYQQFTRDILNWISQHYPDLDKRIAWSSPTFVAHGTHIISFKATKKHLAASIEGTAIRHFAEIFDQQGLHYGKMTINFPWTEKVNLDLLNEIIAFNLDDKKDLTTFWRK